MPSEAEPRLRNKVTIVSVLCSFPLIKLGLHPIVSMYFSSGK